MKNTKCWIFHTWMKWVDMREPEENAHNCQIKECEQCGKKVLRWYAKNYNNQ